MDFLPSIPSIDRRGMDSDWRDERIIFRKKIFPAIAQPNDCLYICIQMVAYGK